MLVLFASSDDLIADFLRVDEHAPTRCNPQRLESIGSLNEFSLPANLPFRSGVLENALPNGTYHPHLPTLQHDAQNTVSPSYQLT